MYLCYCQIIEQIFRDNIHYNLTRLGLLTELGEQNVTVCLHGGRIYTGPGRKLFSRQRSNFAQRNFTRGARVNAVKYFDGTN